MIKKLLCLPFLAFALYFTWIYGHLMAWRTIAPSDTAFMRARMAQLASSHPKVQLNHQWVDYDAISIHLKQAVIASEDSNFVTHNGFDWWGIRQAIKRNQKSGNIRAGGSTITQQLAKNLFLNEKRSYTRKAQEAVIAAMLESTSSKRRIYELYLNLIEWGYGVYGAQSAAQVLHKKSASALNKNQAAELASRIPAPLRYAKNPKDQRLRNKTKIILRRMHLVKIPE